MNQVTVTIHQEPIGFDLPEFFQNGPVMTITKDERPIEIHRDGLSLAFYDKPEAFGDVIVLRGSEDFREAFPDGIIPDDLVEFRSNGWFDLYDGEGNHLDIVGYELGDMIRTVMREFGLVKS